MKREADLIHFDPEDDMPDCVENPLPLDQLSSTISMVGLNLKNHTRRAEAATDADEYNELITKGLQEYIALKKLMDLHGQIERENAAVAGFAGELDEFKGFES